jgi:hypothetical protein
MTKEDMMRVFVRTDTDLELNHLAAALRFDPVRVSSSSPSVFIIYY